MRYYLAVDIGASTLRLILGWYEADQIQLKEVYRSPNEQTIRDHTLCWNPDLLFADILAGMKECARQKMIPVSMGIDTWGVDYVLLDEQNKIVGDSVAYRDERTAGMEQRLEESLPFDSHYRLCGIAKQPFNTVYQLMAQFSTHPEHRNRAVSFLMMPDYLHFLLTGKKANEYTNASTTALLDAKSKTWCKFVLQKVSLPTSLFSLPLKYPGQSLGHLLPAVQQEVGFSTKVILPPTHDTASAFVAVPAKDGNAVFLSSGTWSLLGVENDVPRCDLKALEHGFTNEGGYQGTIRFLKNIMGLWILQSLHRCLEGKYSFAELSALAEEADDYPGRIDVNDQRFLAPEDMRAEIHSALAEQGYPTPTLSQLLACVHHSLAQGYAKSIAQLQTLLGRTFTSIHIVGGGSQNDYLNRLTAKKTALPVYAGPTEGTALGNLLTQMIQDGIFSNWNQARLAVARSFPISLYQP